MNKIGALLLVLLASKGVAAGEVGAPIPQLANSTAILAVAIAEAGATARWTPGTAEMANKSSVDNQLEGYVQATFDAIHQDVKDDILADIADEKALVSRY